MSRLEIAEDMEFQKRAWAFERVAFVGFLLVLLFVFLGGTGSGPFSTQSSRSLHGSITMEAPRAIRVGAKARITIAITAPSETSSDEIQEIAVSNEFLEHVHLFRTLPEPVAIEDQGHRSVLRFAFGGESRPRNVVLDFEALRPGRIDGTLGVQSGEELRFCIWGLP
jgi:hypothetical protein